MIWIIVLTIGWTISVLMNVSAISVIRGKNRENKAQNSLIIMGEMVDKMKNDHIRRLLNQRDSLKKELENQKKQKELLEIEKVNLESQVHTLNNHLSPSK